MSAIIGVDVTTATANEPVQAAQEAERLGFDFVSASDHPVGGPPSYETWTLLTWIAAATSRITVATRVLAVPLRNPGLVAKMAESLDRLSGGRLVLGLGGGYSDEEFRALGLAAPTPRQKVDGMRDAVEIAHAVWTPGAASYEGSVHSVRAAEIDPKPAHRIPVWLGTYGDRALAVTGRLADGWIPSLGAAPEDRLPTLRAKLFAAAADAGRDAAELTCVLNLQVRIGGDGPADVTGTAVEVRDRLLGLLDLGFTGFNLQGDPRQWEQLAAEVLPALRAKLG